MGSIRKTVAFCNAEEFSSAYDALLAFCLMRIESVRLRLNGQLSARTEDQNLTARADASSITIGDLE